MILLMSGWLCLLRLDEKFEVNCKEKGSLVSIFRMSANFILFKMEGLGIGEQNGLFEELEEGLGLRINWKGCKDKEVNGFFG